VDDRVPRVFISYSHEPEHHRETVVKLANRLRDDGFESWIDRYIPAPAEGWLRWMHNQVQDSDFVLLFCTEVYCRRFEGKEKGKGRGARFESRLAETILYFADDMESRRFVPVLPDGEPESSVPLSFLPCSHYFFPSQYDDLICHLENRPPIKPPPVQPRGRKFKSLAIPEIRPIPDIACKEHGWAGWIFLLVTFLAPLGLWLALAPLSQLKLLALTVSDAVLAGATAFFLGPEVFGSFAQKRLPRMLIAFFASVVISLFWQSSLSFLRPPQMYKFHVEILDHDGTPINTLQPTLQLPNLVGQASHSDEKGWTFEVSASSLPWSWDGSFKVLFPGAEPIVEHIDPGEAQKNLSYRMAPPRFAGIVLNDDLGHDRPIQSACVQLTEDLECRKVTGPDGKFDFTLEARHGQKKLLVVNAPGFCPKREWRDAGDTGVKLFLSSAKGGCP